VSWRLVLWLVPVHDTPSNGWGALALNQIWYLRDYLWFVLASPLALWLFRRHPLPTLLAPYAVLAVVELRYPSAPTPLRDFGLYCGSWLLGFAHHDGMLRRLSGRILVPLAAALGTLAAVWIFTHPGPRGYDLNDIRLGNSLWSAGFTLLLPRAPAKAPWVDGNALLSRAVTVVNRRALTVYLWHMPIVIGLTAIVLRAGRDPATGGGIAVRLAATAGLVTLAVALFGWVEDLASRRRPVLLPAGEHPVPTRPAPASPPVRAAIPAQRAVPDLTADCGTAPALTSYPVTAD
jgi:peptidoglycan/LPS O-acetylase OafA/YrhL